MTLAGKRQIGGEARAPAIARPQVPGNPHDRQGGVVIEFEHATDCGAVRPQPASDRLADHGDGRIGPNVRVRQVPAFQKLDPHGRRVVRGDAPDAYSRSGATALDPLRHSTAKLRNVDCRGLNPGQPAYLVQHLGVEVVCVLRGWVTGSRGIEG